MTDDRIRELEAQVARLSETVGRLERAQRSVPALDDEVDRRHALRHLGTLAAGALAGGAALAVGTASPASAAAPVSGISATDDGVYGETSAQAKAGVHGVAANTQNANGVLAELTGGGSGSAIKAVCDGIGPAIDVHGYVLGLSVVTTQGLPSVAISNTAENGVGLYLDADQPIILDKARVGNPADGATFGNAGSIVRFEAPGSTASHPIAELWYCTQRIDELSGGAQYRKLAGPATAGALHVLAAPIRVYDSRLGLSPATGPKTPMAADSTRDVSCAAAVPVGATAVVANLTVVDTVGIGYLAAFDPSVAYAGSSNLNWSSSGQVVVNSALVSLDANREIRLLAAGGATDVVVDIQGYYL